MAVPKIVLDRKPYEDARLNYLQWDLATKVCKELMDKAEGNVTKTKIQAYSITNDYVRLQLASPLPHDNNRTLNGYHFILGLASDIKGLREADFIQDTGDTDWTRVKFYEDKDDRALKLTPGAYILSNRVGLTPTNKRFGFTLALLNTYCKKYDPKNKAKWIEAGYGYSFTQNLLSRGGIGNVIIDDRESDADNVQYYSKQRDQYFEVKTARGRAKEAFEKAKKQLQADAKAAKLPDPFKKTDDGGGGGSQKPPKVKPDADSSSGVTGVGDDTKPVIYNLPGVKESYFTAQNELVFVTAGNVPAKVASAQELWTKAGAHKGMIQQYIVPGALGKNVNWFKPQDSKLKVKDINLRRYGFQFLYNPSTISMHYAGAPQVDIGLQTSGLDKVALIGAGVTSSSVTFQLLLNRMNDMKYINALRTSTTTTTPGSTKTTNVLVDDNLVVSNVFTPAKSVVTPNWQDPQYPYPWQIPSNEGAGRTMTDELKKIESLGTMYDVEYLLRTLLGYQLKSSMRGVLTSDIGYLGAYPVELHLGKGMRYLVTIDSFELSHTIFTKDMIPVFSNLQITANRLPDFSQKTLAGVSKTEKKDS